MPRTKGFQAFTVKFTGQANRVITDLRVHPAFDPAKGPRKNLPAVETNALWDTGATKSVISHDVAQALALVPVGTAQVHHAGGVRSSPTYMVSFFLPNKVGVAGVLVTELPKGHIGGFGAIIGMDVICLGDLSLTNVDGKTCLSFRTPSIDAIDYVADANRIKFAGVGRNDLCPCGSGKKFKKCCQSLIRP